MSHARDPTMRTGRAWLVVPSWLASLAFHVGLLAVLALTLERPDVWGDPEAAERQVGIYTKSSHDAVSPSPADEPDSGAGAGAASAASDAPRPVDDAPPVELDLPVAAAPPLIGPGAAVPADPGDLSRLIRPSGGPLPAQAPGGGGTTFFGQKASGSRFIYVIDASGSMYDHDAIAVAKAELLASLEQLDESQQFLVIFYNETAVPMVAPDGRLQLFRGTAANRSLASQFIRSVRPDGGTRHFESLRLALNYDPDVIFFLTDAGEPILTAAELDRIHKRNKGGARIHTIEFGKGANLKNDNFLKKLARENSGTHVYRDVTQFRGR